MSWIHARTVSMRLMELWTPTAFHVRAGQLWVSVFLYSTAIKLAQGWWSVMALISGVAVRGRFPSPTSAVQLYCGAIQVGRSCGRL